MMVIMLIRLVEIIRRKGKSLYIMHGTCRDLYLLYGCRCTRRALLPLHKYYVRSEMANIVKLHIQFFISFPILAPSYYDTGYLNFILM